MICADEAHRSTRERGKDGCVPVVALSAADRGDERALFSCVFLYGRDAPTRPAYIDDALCDVIGCHGYDVNIAAAAARRKMLIAG